MRMKSSAVAFGLATLLCAFMVGCEAIGASEEDPQQNLRPGSYAFTAYDLTGTAIIEGTLSLSFPRESRWDIEGTWEFRRQAGDVSPRLKARMTGQGQLHGTIQEGGNVRISLHPEIEDADSVLRGDFEDGDLFQGEWAITDWGTDTAGGHFVAKPE